MSKSRFGLGRKLLAVCLAFGLPIAVMSVLMTQAKLGEIEFAEKERMGDALQRPLQDLMQHLGRHERLWDEGSGAGAPAPELDAERAAVVAALAALRAADQRYGQELQFTPEGLGLRGREQFTVQNLERKWQELGSIVAGSLNRGADSRGIIEHVRTMITHAGDASNLILDPDLDSYYLMDATLLALPQMEERIQEVARQVDATFGAAGSPPRELDVKQRMRFATLAAFLKQSDWERVLASTNTAFNEDPNFHGESPSLRAELAPHLASVGESVARVVEAVEQLASGARALDRRQFRADLEALDAQVYGFHRAALAQEDRLLELRIVDFQSNLRLGLALAAGSVLVSMALAFALSRNILGRLRRLSLATEAFARGDLGARVGAAGGDEIGQLAGSFDAMTGRIGGLTAEVRERAQELEQINGNLEQTVLGRTQELRQRNDAFRMILDHAHDGMLTVDLGGNVSSERSAVLDRWFGTPAAGVRLGNYLAPDQPTLAAELELGLEQVAAGFLPVEVCLDQLPRQLVRAGRRFRIAYQPIAENGSLSRVLLIVSDATAEIEGRLAVALQEDVLRMMQACQRDRPGFLNFFIDTRELVAKLTCGGLAPAEWRRAVHTLKGNSGLFGVLTLSRLCHEVENNIAENCALLASDVARLRSAWSELSDSVAQIMGDTRSQQVEVDDAEYGAIVDSIARGTPRREILEAIGRWRLEPAERRLQRLAEQARALARKLGKEVDVTVRAHDVRLCAQTWLPLWSTLSHAIRNAIDHGIDGADERAARGLPRAGALLLETRVADGRFLLEVSDDGGGVDWQRVSAQACAAGLAKETAEDLMEALFVDGISSKSIVDDISGRGVGMAALRQACRELGGDVVVDTDPARGTAIRCSFPAVRMGGELSASIAGRALTLSLSPQELSAQGSGAAELRDGQGRGAAAG
ncbi:MAG: HAMP domain-containing protein [Deltaproteobacteria bacterium]